MAITTAKPAERSSSQADLSAEQQPSTGNSSLPDLSCASFGDQSSLVDPDNKNRQAEMRLGVLEL